MCRKARRGERRIRTIARRLLREITRKLSDDGRKRHAQAIRVMGIAVRQTSEPGCDSIHSLHEPDVVCIAKSKAHKPYEFGCKVSVAIDPTSGLIVAAQQLPGRMRDRVSIAPTLEQVVRLTGYTPTRVIADLGYRGPAMLGATTVVTPATMRGSEGSTRKRLRRALRRRQLVEAVIGRMKSLHWMGRNFLKGIIGDQVNCAHRCGWK